MTSARASGAVRIEYVALGQLIRWPRNAKRHRLDHLEESFRRFGYVMPLLVDENSGKLVAGHGRLEGLSARKQAGHAAPERIEDRGDDWYVPVIRGVSFRNAKEAEAYLLADNRITELGGWDNAELVASLQAVQDSPDKLLGVGWTSKELDELIETAGDEVLAQGEETEAAPDQSDKADVGFCVLVDCDDEDQQLGTIEALLKLGYRCRALT